MKKRFSASFVTAGILAFAFGMADCPVLAAGDTTAIINQPVDQSAQTQPVHSQQLADLPASQQEIQPAPGLAVSPATAIAAPAKAGSDGADGKALRQAWTAYNIGNYKKTVSILTPLAESGNAQAQVLLGRCLESGLGIGEDPAQAVQWYQKAAEQNNNEAIAQLAFCYETGVGVEQNAATAVALMQKAANGGYPEAQFKIAMYFSRGQYGVDKNPAAAFQWAMLAARQGHAQSQRFVGACLEYGLGTPKDNQQATTWYAKAAKQGLEKDAGLIRQVRGFSGPLPTSYDNGDQPAAN